eukprot:GFUD01019701.1.p1 GENE.GFUD01019701.1~~GFUD01019701.1.p1  ORF type:complete len:360 (-),score=111.73 GFUD01019701.1:91-1170(-)
MSHSRLGLADAWGNLRSVRFNQDMTAFVCAFQDGLRIFNIDPIREQAHYKEEQVGSIAHAEMLYRTNLVALVSGGRRPKFADNTVMIYDDLAGKMVLEFTFPDQVLAVRMKKDKIVAVCKNQIHVFSFPNKPKKLFSVDTRDNPLGLCEVSPIRCGEKEVMVFPGYKTGSIQMVDLFTTEQRVSSAPVSLNAHKNELVCLAINQQGTMVATASTKGTLIRIWDTSRRVQLVELRRGADQAKIYCINFSSSDEWLCCSSDKGTVHIFALQDYRLNKRSALASIGVPGAYAGSQWSLASFTVPQECACICAFGTQGHIAAVCLDGSFHKYHFSADGICNQAKYDVITELCEDCDWLNMKDN